MNPIHLNYRLASGWPAELIAIALVVGLFWLVVLASALARPDLDPVTKFMWVFVIVTTSVIGVLLYLFIAPSPGKIRRAKLNYENEPTTCVICRSTIPGGSSVCPKCGWTYTKGESAA